MIMRKHPGLSAYEEGALEAETMLADIMVGGHDWRGYSSADEAVQSYCELAQGIAPMDAEHAELLSGYLDRFRRG